jgi:DNA-binding transcriptional LysR family regulator
MMHYFDEVARHGSIRRAAERLNISASAVNRQILNLEEQVGIALFERLPRGMRITEAGSILLAALRRFEHDSSVAMSQVDALRGLRRGHVSIGSLLFLSENYIPRLITTLRSLYPHISYSAFFGTSEEVTSRVVNGKLDIGVCWNPPPSSPVRRKAVKKIPLGVATLPSHPIAAKPGIRLRDLLNYPVIFPEEGTDYRDILDRINVGVGRSLSPSVVTTSMSMMRRLAIAGVGVALVSRTAVIDDLRAGTLVLCPLLDPGSQTLSLSLFTRAERELPVAVEMVLHHFETEFRVLVSEPDTTSGKRSASRSHFGA